MSEEARFDAARNITTIAENRIVFHFATTKRLPPEDHRRTSSR